MEEKSNSYSYLRQIIFLLIIMLIFLYYLALSSYSPLDSSLNSASFPPLAIRNLVGYWGAKLSASMIYFLGLGSYLIPLPVFLMGIFYFRQNLSIKKALISFLSPTLVYMTLLYFLWNFLPDFSVRGFEISTLGKTGLWLGDSFYGNLGKLGSPIVAVMFALIAFSFLINTKSSQKIMQIVSKKK